MKNYRSTHLPLIGQRQDLDTRPLQVKIYRLISMLYPAQELAHRGVVQWMEKLESLPLPCKPFIFVHTLPLSGPEVAKISSIWLTLTP